MQQSKQAKSLAKKIAEYELAKEAGKSAYKRSDTLLEEIVAESGANLRPPALCSIKMKDGTRRRVVDRFQTKSVVFQPCGVRRYEIEEC
jgi:hypothetical protein